MHCWTAQVLQLSGAPWDRNSTAASITEAHTLLVISVPDLSGTIFASCSGRWANPILFCTIIKLTLRCHLYLPILLYLLLPYVSKRSIVIVLILHFNIFTENVRLVRKSGFFKFSIQFKYQNHRNKNLNFSLVCRKNGLAKIGLPDVSLYLILFRIFVIIKIWTFISNITPGLFDEG